MSSSRLRLAVLCALLAACAPQQQGAPATSQPEQAAAQGTPQDGQENASEGKDAPDDVEAEAAEAAQPEADSVPESAALPTPPPIDDDPEKLIGLDRAGLGGKLGQPELVRQEAPAEIWQYRIEDCVFDVFLYDQRVTYLEARDRAAQAIDPRACLNRLLRARMKAPLG